MTANARHDHPDDPPRAAARLRTGASLMEWFLNPYAMIFGGLLVSAPIIIHLINRMRFKRVRWAAMEFLLKSQKKNRRKLIVEQLVLLALRCLLVLLAGGFLFARFIGARTPPPPPVKLVG